MHFHEYFYFDWKIFLCFPYIEIYYSQISSSYSNLFQFPQLYSGILSVLYFQKWMGFAIWGVCKTPIVALGSKNAWYDFSIVHCFMIILWSGSFLVHHLHLWEFLFENISIVYYFFSKFYIIYEMYFYFVIWLSFKCF